MSNSKQLTMGEEIKRQIEMARRKTEQMIKLYPNDTAEELFEALNHHAPLNARLTQTQMNDLSQWVLPVIQNVMRSVKRAEKAKEKKRSK
jgi:hypothetical protein